MKTLLNPCFGFFPSLFRFNQTSRLENRYGFEHDIHLFSSLSRSNEPKDLKTKCFVRVFLPQIPSLYPSERYKDLKITIPQDRHPSNIPSFRSQNIVKRLESLHSVRTAGSGGRVFGRLGRPGFGGFTFSLSKTALIRRPCVPPLPDRMQQTLSRPIRAFLLRKKVKRHF